MPLPEIKAVTFDAAHTIYHPHPSVGAIYREVMQRHGLDYLEEELESGFRRAFSSVRKDGAILDGEKREWSYWYSIVSESISHFAPQPDDFDSLFEDVWQAFAEGHRWQPEATAKLTLEALRERGFKTALLTNWDQRVRQVVAETGFGGLFDHVFVSSEIGFEKPDPRIFKHCEAVLELAPEQILHVGDSKQHDIEGAKAAGWSAARVSQEAAPTPKHSIHIRELSELLDIL